MKRKRKPLAIALDLDDTISEFLPFLCKLHNKLHGTCITTSDLKTWDFANVNLKDKQGNIVTGDQLRETFHKYEPDGLYSILPPIRDSRFALELIKELGYKIIIITARKSEYRNQTILNLMFNNIHYDKLFFEDNKVKKLKELSKIYNIQAFVDDKYDTIIDVFENCNINKIFIINMPHNVKLELDEEILRVNDIMEILRYLKKVK
jgi:uncharacterized HAD superfamily protein